MDSKEFNLLEEKWILVRKDDCTVQEVSLADAILYSHEYATLSGELPTQDMAIQRLMLAIVETVFTRFDEYGQPAQLCDEDDAFDRWGTLWNLKKFPEKPLRDYFEKYHERFYLFHPERPFYQNYSAKEATKYYPKTLNGLISESNNKKRLFSQRAGKYKDELTYAEAARWLVYNNAYDNSSLKDAKTVEVGSEKGEECGTGWLAKLGMVTAKGNNLFETLMLNFVMCNANEEVKENKPIWEEDKLNGLQKHRIPQPNNQAALMTVQSRKILLVRENGKVIGYNRMWGDFFDSTNMFTEQMTMWAYNKKKKQYYPKMHDTEKQIWREFSSIVTSSDENHNPGVVEWQKRLKINGELDNNRVAQFVFTGVNFDSKKSAITEVYSDSITFHLDLLTEVGKTWRNKVQDELGLTDEVAKAVKWLGTNIEKAGGGKGDNLSKWMGEQFYYRIDIPFRQFLASIDSQNDEQDEKMLAKWREDEIGIAKALAQEVISQVDKSTLVGRQISEDSDKNKKNKKKKKGGKEKNEKHFYSAANSYDWFQHKLDEYLGDGDERKSGKQLQGNRGVHDTQIGRIQT